MGGGGVRARPRGRQAAARLHRVLVVPLVPRHGAGVVRRPGHSGRHERAVRLRQGRSRGAAGRRLRLHGRGCLAHGPGRLAAHRLPHARRRAVLRRDVLPARAAARAAGVPPGPARGRRRVPRTAAGCRGAGRVARRCAPALGGDGAVSRASARGTARGGRRDSPAATRSASRWVRLRAEIPARVGSRVPAPSRFARRRPPDARRDGGRRDVRPRRRWLPPLLRRRGVARTALREDALRQRAARPSVSPRVAAHRRRALPRGCGADARLHGGRAAAAEWRLCLGAGRRHRRRRGIDVHVDGGGRSPGRAAAAVRARPLDHPR